ncbi:MAG: COMM domain-containing protein [Myxococcota bacterium]
MPEDIRREIPRLAKLPPSLVGELGPLVTAFVLEGMSPSLGEQLSRLGNAYAVEDTDLVSWLRVSRWLIRQSSATAISAEELASDIQLLWPDDPAVFALLLATYARVRDQVRDELVSSALKKHGNLLADVDWRIDYISSERHVPRIDTHVAMVTLRYHTGAGEERLTLQMTLHHLQRLARLFASLAERLEGPHAPGQP